MEMTEAAPLGFPCFDLRARRPCGPQSWKRLRRSGEDSNPGGAGGPEEGPHDL